MPTSLLKRPFFFLKAGGVFFFLSLFAYLTYLSTHPTLPSEQTPILFYSNQTKDNLKILFSRAIQQAKHSIFLQIYGFTDLDLIRSLQVAKQQGKALDVFYDPKASLEIALQMQEATPLSCQGLMHKKILIVDDEQVFLGSTNFTPTSLRMHDNIVLGLYQKQLAEFLKHSLDPFLSFSIQGQEAEFWHLPDFRKECLQRILQSIQKAKHSIHLFLRHFRKNQMLTDTQRIITAAVKILF